MNLKELKNKSLGELQKLLAEERARLRDLRFQVAAEQHKQVHELGQSKKTIARILTLLKQTNINLSAKQKSSDSVDKKENSK